MLEERDARHEVDEGRREALLKASRLSAYVAPAMLALLLSKKALAVSSGNCGGGNGPDGPPPGGGFDNCGPDMPDAPVGTPGQT